MTNVPNPIAGARSSATTCASAASSTVSSRLKLVGLQVRTGQLAMGVVLLRKEATRAQDHAVEPVFEIVKLAQPLGSELGHSVDVPRSERAGALVEPDGGGTCLLPNGLRNHQRRGRGEDEPVMTGSHRRLQQVERAGHIDLDEGLRRNARDVRFMKGASMDDGLDAVARAGPLHQRPISHRADNACISSGRDVEPDHDMTGRAEARGEEPAEPSRRAGEKNAHHATLVCYRFGGSAHGTVPCERSGSRRL